MGFGIIAGAAAAALAFGAAPGVGVEVCVSPFLELESLTQGTGCDADVGYWNSNGHISFETDLRSCTLAYIAGSTVDQNRVRDGVTQCMQGNENSNLYSGTQFFTASCSACMGALAQCTAKECEATCSFSETTGFAPELCRECTITDCVPTFFECAGLDTTRPPGEACDEDDANLITIIGAAGGGAFLVMCLGIAWGLRRHSNHLAQERDEFAKQLAFAVASAPEIASPAPQGVDMNQAKSLDVTLIAVHAFEGQSDDELDLQLREKVIGVQIVDNDWYLAQNAAGEVGLVPRNYVQELDIPDDPNFTPLF